MTYLYAKIPVKENLIGTVESILEKGVELFTVNTQHDGGIDKETKTYHLRGCTVLFDRVYAGPDPNDATGMLHLYGPKVNLEKLVASVKKTDTRLKVQKKETIDKN